MDNIYKNKLIKYQNKYNNLNLSLNLTGGRYDRNNYNDDNSRYNRYDNRGGKWGVSSLRLGITKKEKQQQAYNEELDRLNQIDTSDSEEETNQNIIRQNRYRRNFPIYRQNHNNVINEIKERERKRYEEEEQRRYEEEQRRYEDEQLRLEEEDFKRRTAYKNRDWEKENPRWAAEAERNRRYNIGIHYDPDE
jgi:hypothetical protein